MNKFKTKLYRFMYGRYGTDKLNLFLSVLAFITIALQLFMRNNYMVWIAWILLSISIFRMYSKNHVQRRKENTIYLNITRPIRKRISLYKKQSKDKEYKYYLCPTCKQIIRVPRGRGQITITCPTCRQKFDKKT